MDIKAMLNKIVEKSNSVPFGWDAEMIRFYKHDRSQRKDRCVGCGRYSPIDRLVILDKEVPFGARGRYHVDCAYSALKTYQKICTVCGQQYTEKIVYGTSTVCKKCLSNDKVKRESSRIIIALSRARRSGLPATLTVKEWMENLDHFNWSCAYCGKSFDVIEHFVPIARGGGTTKGNCVPACNSCNKVKNDKDPHETKVKNITEVAAYLKRMG